MKRLALIPPHDTRVVYRVVRRYGAVVSLETRAGSPLVYLGEIKVPGIRVVPYRVQYALVIGQEAAVFIRRIVGRDVDALGKKHGLHLEGIGAVLRHLEVEVRQPTIMSRRLKARGVRVKRAAGVLGESGARY